ncbi:MAG: Flp pilus assembly protein TadG [Kiritimatiellia bacterium]|jgi:Flp pilus assembly protein TadG
MPNGRQHEGVARRRRRGGTAIEFGLTMPAFVFILAMFVDYGWIFFHKAMLDTSVHRGCRAGAVADPDRLDNHEEAKKTILAELALAGVDCGVDCVVTLTDLGVTPSRSMECNIVRDYVPLFGIVPAPATLHAQTIMRYEWQI